MIWDGQFPNVECRLRFVDGERKPVQGVTMTVLTRSGTVCHYYPVDEFVPEQPLASDAEGWIVFHHSTNGLEFSGRVYSNLIGMEFGRSSSPRYDCVFHHGEREVFRTAYRFHGREWDEFGKGSVTRRWAPPWYSSKPEEERHKDYEARRRLLFDGNRDNLDREQLTAVGSFQRRYGSNSETDEITFAVVERTIVIPNP
jgi:hypothetical protein